MPDSKVSNDGSPIYESVNVGSNARGGYHHRSGVGPVTATSFLTDLGLHVDDTRNMKLTTLGKLFKRSTVNISGSPITDIAGDSYDHTHYGDIYKKISIHPSQAGKQLRSYHFEPLGSV